MRTAWLLPDLKTFVRMASSWHAVVALSIHVYTSSFYHRQEGVIFNIFSGLFEFNHTNFM
jgi:hypothetical protein